MENAFFEIKMIVKNLCALLFVYIDLRAAFVGATKTKHKLKAIEKHSSDFEIIGEKKIRFTGNSGQVCTVSILVIMLLQAGLIFAAHYHVRSMLLALVSS